MLDTLTVQEGNITHRSVPWLPSTTRQTAILVPVSLYVPLYADVGPVSANALACPASHRQAHHEPTALGPVFKTFCGKLPLHSLGDLQDVCACDTGRASSFQPSLRICGDQPTLSAPTFAIIHHLAPTLLVLGSCLAIVQGSKNSAQGAGIVELIPCRLPRNTCGNS